MRAANPGGGGALATELAGAGGGATDSAARVGARITALVPVKHYHPVYLEECLRSLAAQTCAAWRCLVVVEGEDRAHLASVLQEALADPRTQLRTNEGRKLAGAINTG